MRLVIAFLSLWIGLVFETTIFQIPPFDIIHPNLTLVVLILVALVRGPKAALVLGIAIGLIQDVDYGQFIGLNAFAYGVIGYFAGTAFMQFLHRNVAITFLITVLFTFVHVWVTYGMTRMFDVTADSGTMVLATSLWQMLVNGIALLLLYPLLTKWLIHPTNNTYADPEKDIAP